MSAVQLPPQRRNPPESPEDLFGRLAIHDPAVGGLWSQQADILRRYKEECVDSRDVALELPTGSGKTLVGLLIAEWRRLAYGERCAFVCPTNQLAAQVHSKAIGYGIDAELLIGPSDQWPQGARQRVTRSRAIAITNYNHIFNRTPRLNPQMLILDDAHAAESSVAGRWSLQIPRTENRSAYMALVRAVAGELSEHHARNLLTDGLASHSSVEAVLPDAVQRSRDAIAAVLDEYVPETSQWYPWDAIGGSLPACILYASWSEVLIRPFIPPTFGQRTFTEADQRVYLSATLGSGGELERSFGRSPIERVGLPPGRDRDISGRRFILAPGGAHGTLAANAIIRSVVARVGKALVLAPSTSLAEATAGVVVPDGTEKRGPSSVEDAVSWFIEARAGALVLANRYDGIDFPGNACRLIVLTGLPSGTHLQEQFLGNVLHARHALSERIRTRISQGIGRATRSARDIAVVLLHSDPLLSFIGEVETQAAFRPELQAEMELAFENCSLPEDDVLTAVDSFLNQDGDWTQTEEWLRVEAQSRPQTITDSSADLAAAAEFEILACDAAWRGAFDEAFALARTASVALAHADLANYRAWWLALGASWSVLAEGDGSATSIEAAREVANATRRMDWRPTLAVNEDALAPEDALFVRGGRAASWLRRWYRSKRFELQLEELEGGIAGTEAVAYELALERLGTLLGFESIRPNGEADPDGCWRDGDRAWLLWEAKTESRPAGEVSATVVRQANTHADWVRRNISWPEPSEVITGLITPQTRVHPSVGPIAAENVYLVPPSMMQKIASEGIAIHRRVSAELIGLNDHEQACRIAELFEATGLSTPKLLEGLTQGRLAVSAGSSSSET